MEPFSTDQAVHRQSNADGQAIGFPVLCDGAGELAHHRVLKQLAAKARAGRRIDAAYWPFLTEANLAASSAAAIRARALLTVS